ncbi:MAG: hypothetical protein II471_02255 [Bacteroidales bacterium]|nr:hypothetical protein [Bacteroidales bacterium]
MPSGLLWATCNVGATNPEDYGDYFEWGDTETKDVYHYSNNRHYDAVNRTHTKYISKDGLVVLESNDDAATANLGNGWRMPTKEDVEELLNNCTNVLTTINGVDGHLFTGSNGNSIFMPAAGYRSDSSFYHDGSEGHYWSSTPMIGDPFAMVWYFYFELGDYTHNIAPASRSFGYSVRAVCQPQK